MNWIFLAMVCAAHLRFPCYTSGNPTVLPLGVAFHHSAMSYEGLTEQTAKVWLKNYVDQMNVAFRGNFNIEFRVVSLLFPSNDIWLQAPYRSPRVSYRNCGNLQLNTERYVHDWSNHCRTNCPVKTVAWHLFVGCRSRGAPGAAAQSQQACRNKAQTLSVTWNWYIMAHEIAHLFGAHHARNGIMRPGNNDKRVNGVVQFTDSSTERRGNFYWMCLEMNRVRPMVTSGTQCPTGFYDVTQGMADVLL